MNGRLCRMLSRRWVVVWCIGLILAAGTMEGCAGPIRSIEMSDRSDQRYVRLEAQLYPAEGSEVRRFDHPMNLHESEWNQVLKNIYVQPRKGLLPFGQSKVEPTPAFSESDQLYLSSRLAETLAQATSTEWAVFYLAHPRESGLTEVTSGAVFSEHGRVHLLLANYEYTVTIPFLSEQIRRQPLRASGDVLYEVVPREDQVVVSEYRWDLPKPLFARSVELSIDLDSGRQGSDGQGAGNEVTPTEDGKAMDQAGHLEERLRTLERLYRQGLITQDEYEGKRQQLLDQL